MGSPLCRETRTPRTAIRLFLQAGSCLDILVGESYRPYLRESSLNISPGVFELAVSIINCPKLFQMLANHGRNLWEGFFPNMNRMFYEPSGEGLP